MWSTLKRSSGAQLGHDKRDIPAFDTVLFHSNLSSLRRKYLGDVPTDKIVLSYGPEISKRPLKICYWWLKNKARKCHFRFVERGFLAAINCTGSAEGALVPVLLRITHWPQERTARFTARPFSALVQQHAIFSGFFTHVYRRLILFRFGFSRLRTRLSRPVIVR